MDLGKVLTLGPVADLLDLFFVQDATFSSAFVSNNRYFWHSKGKFLGRNCYTYILKSLKDAVIETTKLTQELAVKLEQGRDLLQWHSMAN